MTIYYVDGSASTGGNGLSMATPLTTLAEVNSLHLGAGDSVLFKAGTSYTGSTSDALLTITANGTAANPITYGTYGAGAAPEFANTFHDYSSTIAVKGASYVNLQGLAVTNGMEAGVRLDAATQHVTIRDMDISNTGTGIILDGSNNAVTDNKIHDLHMVVNTPGPTNDDYGAEAVIVSGQGHTISGNQINNAKAQSYDYGTDGGAFEFWGAASNIHIAQNAVRNSDGFIEMGGQPGAFSNIEVDHNTSFNSSTFLSIHNGGGAFGSAIANVNVHANTIVDTTKAPGSLSTVWLDAPVTSQQLQFSANIVSMNAGDSVFNQQGDYHTNNMFDLKSVATHLYNNWNMTLNSGESFAAPAFTNPAAGDLTIARGATGSNLGAYSDASSAQGSTSPSAPSSTPNGAATAAAGQSAPIAATASSITGLNPIIHASDVLDLSDLIQMTGTPSLVKLVDWWNTPGSGVFELNGVAKPQATEFVVPASELANLHYVVGDHGQAGQDLIGVQVSNDGGQTWGTNGKDWGWVNIGLLPI